ncbi:hypothetical protein lerEdw1_020453, partial [Lerista edwardsae]
AGTVAIPRPSSPHHDNPRTALTELAVAPAAVAEAVQVALQHVGFTLWEPETLQRHVRTKPQPKTECHILASDNYDNLASALNLTLLLKASLLGGKVDLNGSAKYLKDGKKSQNEVRLVLHYSITTRFEELTMSHLGPQNITYPGAFDQREATHVVTAVLYGAQAFLVFDREVASAENKQDTERELRASIQSLLQEANQGGGATTTQQKEKSKVEKFRCTFYGDVALENNPITDPDAMRIYSDLPKLLGENGEKAVPVKVWLYPLAKLDHRAAELVREVSTDLITRAQAAIEHLSDCQLQCQDLVGSIRGTSFPAMCEGIRRLQVLCKRYRELFQEQLAEILPSVRGGSQGEDVLRDLLTRTELSPFSPKWLAQFLSTKRAEEDYVGRCCLLLQDAELVPSERELRKVLLDPKCRFLLSFTFTSLQKEEPYLLDLEGWIQQISAPASASVAYEGPAAKPWFEEGTVISKVRECTEAFLDSARLHKPTGKVHFIVASVPDQENPGVSIYLYEGGELVSRNFRSPLQTFPPVIGKVSHDSVQVIFGPAPDGSCFAADSGVEFSVLGQEHWVPLDVTNSQREENSFLVRPLLPNTSYQFRFAALSTASLGESGSKSRVVKTLPSSPPGKPEEVGVRTSAICVTWKAPKVIGEGVAIKEYKVQYKEGATRGSQDGEGAWGSVTAGKSSERCRVTGLRPGTAYRFQVLAVSSDGTESAPSEEAIIATLSPDASCNNQPVGEAPSLGTKAFPVTPETQLPAHGHPLQLRMPSSPYSKTLAPGQTRKEEALGCSGTTTGPDDVIEMPALGRPFRLGMLYQCYTDALLSEHLLLDDPEMQRQSTKGGMQTSRTMERIVANTLGEKAAALDIKPSLLTSLLCGLFEVSGAAKYLLGLKTSRHQDSFTYRYSATGQVEQLTLSPAQPRGTSPSRMALDGCTASHVVTAVWYGTQAFLEYDRQAPAPDNIEEDTAGLEVKAMTPPTHSKAQLESGKEDQEPSQALFSCRCYSDFSLESNPVTFQDAVKIQSGFPRLLSKSREESVPLKVRLYPLKKLGLLDRRRPFHEISTGLNSSIKDSFEGLMETGAQCNDLLGSPAAKAFPEIRQRIQQFKDLCAQHQQALQKQLAGAVPLVRQGLQEEKDLEEVLKCAQRSPFSTPSLCAFVDKTEQEVAFVNSLLSVLRGVEVVCLKVLAPKADTVVAFVFTSLHEEEPYLSRLKASLASPKQLGESNGEILCSKGWFEDEPARERATRAAKSFSAFACANLPTKEAQFVVASSPDGSNPGASIYLFRNGCLDRTPVELPAKPLLVQVEEIAGDRVQLRFAPAASWRGAISGYQVECRVLGQENWAAQVTDGRGDTATVRGLRPDTEYQFRCAALSSLGHSESSDVSRPVRTLPASPHEMPQETRPGLSVFAEGGPSIRAEGSRPHDKKDSTKGPGGGEMRPYEQSTKTETRGAFASKLLAESGPEPQGESSALLRSLLRASPQVRPGPPSVHTLPLERSVFSPTSSCLQYRLGKADPQPLHRVVLLLGETGAGKSALVDGMLNYILGVQWEDNVRFSVAHGRAAGSQEASPTEQLTAYEISRDPGLQIPYSLTIIDTPGFGGARGMGRDRAVLEQVREFFSAQGVTDHIDAVCFVVQASQLHLTPSQKHVFNAMLSVFGSNIQDNVCTLVTFAEGQPAPVLEAVKGGKVPCAQGADGAPVHFLFNNAAQFASNVPAEEHRCRLHRTFWQRGARSMEQFFQFLNGLQSQYLTLQSSALNERRELAAAVQGAKPPIRRALVKWEELSRIRRGLEKHQHDPEAGQDFECTLQRAVPVMLDVSSAGYSTTNCQQCHVTCHYPCQLLGDSDKWMCFAMDGAGRCTVCPGRCPWGAHVSQGHRWDYWIKTERRSYAQLEEEYRAAGRGQVAEEKAFAWVLQESRKADAAFEDLVWKFCHHLRRLQSVALQPGSMTRLEFIDLLICSEKEDLQPGWEERIHTLQALREKVLPSPSRRGC